MSAILLSIDPGSVSGAYALFFDDREPLVGDLPVVYRQVHAAEFSRLVLRHAISRAVVENVHSMPKQGVASSFNFGVSVGIIHGVLAAHNVSMRLVTPNQWKRALKLSASKEEARALAVRFFPAVEGLHLKKHAGRAEALLLGQYVLKGGL